ncbi:hypothetical protein GQ600_20594 [Phytophthora cactorum]|nr:hypothetical protein GQ600_20594 [Phytophthora cactorum]
MLKDKVYKPATGQECFWQTFQYRDYVKSFAFMIPPNLRYKIALPPVTTFGTYDTSEVPDWGLAGSFMTVKDTFFTSHEIEISTSVGALQGDGDLSRNTSLTLKHTAGLLAKLNYLSRTSFYTVAKGAVQPADKELQGFLEIFAQEIKRSAQNDHLAPTNPLLAGLTMLDHHFEYLDQASEVVAASQFHSFGHIYSALMNEGRVSIYEEMIFNPSGATAVRSPYYRTFLLSSEFKAMALDTATGGQSPASVDGIKLRPIQRLKEVSQIFRLMTKNDTSFLGGVSSMSLLDMAAEICSQKLFDPACYHVTCRNSTAISRMLPLKGAVRWMNGICAIQMQLQHA